MHGPHFRVQAAFTRQQETGRKEVRRWGSQGGDGALGKVMEGMKGVAVIRRAETVTSVGRGGNEVEEMSCRTRRWEGSGDDGMEKARKQMVVVRRGRC